MLRCESPRERGRSCRQASATAPLGQGPAPRAAPLRGLLRSWANSHQVDDREERHPDDVQRMPEERKTLETSCHAGPEALDGDLGHHHGEPYQPGGDMQSMAAD